VLGQDRHVGPLASGQKETIFWTEKTLCGYVMSSDALPAHRMNFKEWK
jgi:hypothetical protein